MYSRKSTNSVGRVMLMFVMPPARYPKPLTRCHRSVIQSGSTCRPLGLFSFLWAFLQIHVLPSALSFQLLEIAIDLIQVMIAAGGNLLPNSVNLRNDFIFHG